MLREDDEGFWRLGPAVSMLKRSGPRAQRDASCRRLWELGSSCDAHSDGLPSSGSVTGCPSMLHRSFMMA
jgi:hypothetical protein